MKKRKRWVYLLFMPSDDGNTADVFAVFSSRKRAIEEVKNLHFDGNTDVDWYRSELL